MARKLFGWSNKRYNKEYQVRLERNWRRQKEGRAREQKNNRNNKGGGEGN